MAADDSTTTMNSAVSSGSSLSSSSKNDDLSNKTVSLNDNIEGNASEDEGFVSGNEDFEPPVVDKGVAGGSREEAILDGDGDEGKEDKEGEAFVDGNDGGNGDGDSVVDSSNAGGASAVESADDGTGKEGEVESETVRLEKEDEGNVVVEGAQGEDVSEGHSVEPEGFEFAKDGDSAVTEADSNRDSAVTEADSITAGEVVVGENGGENVNREISGVELADVMPAKGEAESEILPINQNQEVNAVVEGAEVKDVISEDGDSSKDDSTIPGTLLVEENGEPSAVEAANDVSVKDEVEPEMPQLQKEEEVNAVSSNGDGGLEDKDTENTPSKPEVTEKALPEDDPVSPAENGPKESSEQITATDSDDIKDADDQEDVEPEADESYFEEIESRAVADISSKHSDEIDGQIVLDSDDDDETDDEGDGKELFDSSALAALLKAATGVDADGDTITITSQDGSRLFSVERPAGLGSSLRSLRPAARLNRPGLFSTSRPSAAETEVNFSEEEIRKLEKLQQVRVKFLRLVHRLGLSPEEPMAAQVLYRLGLLGGRQNSKFFSFDDAKKLAVELEAQGKDDLDFSVNILVLGKNGVGKSATINSLFGEEKAPISTFEVGTNCADVVCGLIDGVKVNVVDTPGLRSSAMDQGFNHRVLSAVKKLTKKTPPDVVLYVDRLNAQNRDLDDLPLLKTITKAFGSSIWRNAVVTLTHAASAPPDGPSGTPLSYEVFVSQRSHVVQQSVGRAVGDIRMMSPSLMNPVSLVENHISCRRNREGQKILPNGQSWRPQLLLLCYSMKILSEASSLARPQEPFDNRKLYGFRLRSPPLPYMLSSMLQSRPHPKLQPDQGGENADSDIELDDLLDSDQEEDDEYDQLPPFTPLRKDELDMLSKEQKKAYFEEYDYRVKLLHKKQWKEELRRIKEIRKKGKDAFTDYGFAEDDADGGATPAPVSVPLPDMTLPPTFDGDNPAYRYRFLEPTSQFIARPVLDTHGWDHDCGYDGVNLEHSLAVLNRFPASYTIQVNKDKKDFTFSFDSAIAAKHGDNISTMANFDIQSMGKQRAYIVRAESKLKKMKNHKPGGGISITFLGENVVPGLRIEDHISLGKQYAFLGSAGAVKSQDETAFGANIELQRREIDYPIGQVHSNLSLSIIKWRGDLALGFNALTQLAVGRNSKIAVRAGINNKLTGQITVRTSSSDHLSLALTAVIPIALSIYKKLWPSPVEKYSIY